MFRDQKISFEKWWAQQVRDGKQPDDHAAMLMAKAGWAGAVDRLRFAGYIEERYKKCHADVGSICRVECGRYVIPVFTSDAA